MTRVTDCGKWCCEFGVFRVVQSHSRGCNNVHRWCIASTALHQRHDSYKTNAPWSRQYNHLQTHERTHSPYTQEFTMLFRSQHIHSVVNTVSQSSFLEYNVIRQCMCLPQWWRWRVHPHALPTQDKIRSPRSCRARPSGFSTSWSQLVLRRRSGRDHLHLLHLGRRLVLLAEQLLLAEQILLAEPA